jgi:hypothetical protein
MFYDSIEQAALYRERICNLITSHLDRSKLREQVKERGNPWIETDASFH